MPSTVTRVGFYFPVEESTLSFLELKQGSTVHFNYTVSNSMIRNLPDNITICARSKDDDVSLEALSQRGITYFEYF